jgi:UDP-N-acetyl-D-mannosaminuronic acid dehydrogenase
MRASICVHGLGYIGLPTAALLAEAGHDVTGCDIAPAVVARVNEGRGGLHEPELDTLLMRAWRSGRLRAGPHPVPAAFHLVAVPTPLDADRRPDLSCVEAATDALARVLRPGDTVILESTVPVGTTERLGARLAAARPDLRVPLPGQDGDIHLAHCPERVIPGRALHELVHNDRVVGGVGPGCAARAAQLWRGVARGELVLTDARTAELVKLAENAFRDVNIAFANELAMVCHRLGVDPWAAIALANRHPRVDILSPGAGVGGHCIAVDPWFLVDAVPEARLLRTAREVNDAVPRRVARSVRDACAGIPAPRVACLGIAYKPDADDLRESPALSVARELAHEGLALSVADPYLPALPNCLGLLSNVRLREAEDAVAEADVVALLVAHTAFRALDRDAFRGKLVVDAVGLLATPP